MTVVILTFSDSSPWTVPADWNNGANTIECIGEGGSGGIGAAGSAGFGGAGGGGGGGGAYATRSNVTLAGTVPFVIGGGGTGTDTNWNSGSIIAKRGSNGTAASGFSPGGGGSGGLALSCTPTTGAFNGGTGASGGGTTGAGGGGGGGAGGAAGSFGAGGAGAAGSGGTPMAGGAGGNGGQGDNLHGGAGGVPGSISGGGGGTGSEMGGGAGGAGGGGSGNRGGNPGSGGIAGGFGGIRAGGGGGSGGGSSTGTAGTVGVGDWGCIIITYTPVLTTSVIGPGGVAAAHAVSDPGLVTDPVGVVGPNAVGAHHGVNAPGLVTSPVGVVGPTAVSAHHSVAAPGLVTSPIGVIGPDAVGSHASVAAPGLHYPTVDIGPDAVGSHASVAAPGLSFRTSWPDCWTLQYDYGAHRWLLIGGDGIIGLTLSRPFRCQADNTFDTVVWNHTGLPNPDPIILWPLSDPVCQCSPVIGPSPVVSRRMVFPPALITTPVACAYCGLNVSIQTLLGYLNAFAVLALHNGPPPLEWEDAGWTPLLQGQTPAGEWFVHMKVTQNDITLSMGVYNTFSSAINTVYTFGPYACSLVAPPCDGHVTNIVIPAAAVNAVFPSGSIPAVGPAGLAVACIRH